MSGFKYIQFLVEFKTTKFLVPVMFPDKLVHEIVANNMIKCLKKHFKNATITSVSAGNILNLEVSAVYGESTTLGLRCDKNDESVINTYCYEHGVL